jgi:site-specific DNA-methyltransferase (adenine-specific)
VTVETGPGWEMRLGDCIEGMRALADDSVDVTITDPPYEAEAHEKGKRQGPGHGRGKHETGSRYARVVDEEFDFQPITERQRLEASIEIGRVTRIAALVFCQVEAAMLWRSALEQGGLVYRRTIPWVKPDAMPSLHGRWPGQSFEAIVLAVRQGATVPIGGKARYYTATRENGPARAHPTAKPLLLMRQIVEDFSLPGDVVLDAFCGSASTGVASTKLNRRFLGFELNRDYFDIACRRLRGEEAKPNPAQPSLFGGAA